MQILQLLRSGSKILKEKMIISHSLDAELILSDVLKKPREKILISLEDEVSKENIEKFNKKISRRAKKEPVAYILRNKEFWKKKFLINRNTLVPRPETELLVEKLVKIFKNKNSFFLDIGTGSGCIILSILEEIKSSRGIGLDISKKAIDTAIKNSYKMKLSNKCKFLKTPLNQIFNYKFDFIVSNPPYICRHQIKNLSEDIKKFEPRIALDGGNDGLDVIKKVIYKSKYILKKRGLLALEIGNGQYFKVSQILKLQGFKINFLIKDYQKNIRCILSTLIN